MHIPEKCLLIVRKSVWSHCIFVPKYEVVRGPAEYEVKTGQFVTDTEDVTLLRPGESAEADDDEVAQDWSLKHCIHVRISNRDGEPEINILTESSLARSD